MSSVQETVAEARAAEAAGARSLWVASHLFFRDPFGLAMALLQGTQRAIVLPMAVSPYAMHPVHAAMAAATLDEMAPDRAALCLGSGNPVDLADVGRSQDRPLRTMREAIEICRRLLAGEFLTFEGEIFRLRGRKLQTAPSRPMPIYLTAMGEQMLALGGAVADGVLLSAASSVEFVRHARQLVDKGADGRKVTLAGLVLTALSADEGLALERHRRRLGFVLRGRHHEGNLRLAGSAVDRDALIRAVAADDWEAARRMISHEVVRAHTASGTAEHCRRRFRSYREAGLDAIILTGIADPAEMQQAMHIAASL
jgi:alkanesulfonate monooxygenase SsuD/methylene tetrahydromethanopterin reductase-like flavin-dependent oxidoreductase (luciferase family)